MSKKTQVKRFPKELEGIISPERLDALKQLVADMKAQGYTPVMYAQPPAAAPANALVIDFLPPDKGGSINGRDA